jgi:hypothetical protein
MLNILVLHYANGNWRYLTYTQLYNPLVNVACTLLRVIQSRCPSLETGVPKESKLWLKKLVLNFFIQRNEQVASREDDMKD